MKGTKLSFWNRHHKEKHVNWTMNYLKTCFSAAVIFSDEWRTTLDGDNGWSKDWVLHENSQCWFCCFFLFFLHNKIWPSPQKPFLIAKNLNWNDISHTKIYPEKITILSFVHPNFIMKTLTCRINRVCVHLPVYQLFFS